jgi:hypothetical protein
MRAVPDRKKLRREYLKRKGSTYLASTIFTLVPRRWVPDRVTFRCLRGGWALVIGCVALSIAAVAERRTADNAIDKPRATRKQLSQELIAAVRRQDLQAVSSLLQAGANPNLIDDHVLTPNWRNS